MDVDIEFLGGKKLKAVFGDYDLLSDQKKEDGGDGNAPDPFEYFLASTALCAGHYINLFCQARKISTDGIKIKQIDLKDETDQYKRTFRLHVGLPSDFPNKYKNALIKAAEGCTVKHVIQTGPEFEIVLE